ncbi:MAG: response regulator [Leptolyngbyaceae cyanobacterium SL_1_1]|nr:response regulator [Leptolyngbyaceae cyanobacterium RM1_1_2]NJO09836.1 response regulator [Leptolyngbyaceae cyanobacterium SL_1_1]
MANDSSYLDRNPHSILIIDDQPDNLRVLATILEGADYFVRKAVNSEFALKTAATTQPDLILLDINMPVIDGYEICRQLKRQPQTQTIPVIFVSALESTTDKLRAFEVGGVDYITKPFHIAEVLARVNTQLRVYQLQRQLRSQTQALQAQNTQLQLEIRERHRVEVELRQQRAETERLLTNMLPQMIAKRLKTNSHTIAEQFDEVGVLFADLVGFSATAAQMPASQLVNLLNEIFSTFDSLVEQHGLEKIKTIGDAYMVAAGIPVPKTGSLEAIAHLALDMQVAIGQFSRPDGSPFELRIGLSVGPVIAGVIGLKKFAYDLWGNTVNVASRMESTSLPSKIQVTEEVYRQLKGQFAFSSRGQVPIRGLGSVKTYFLSDRLPSLSIYKVVGQGQLVPLVENC